VTSSLAVFEAAIRLKSTNLLKIMFEYQKKANMEIKEIFLTQISI